MSINVIQKNTCPKESHSVLFILQEAFHLGWMGATRRLFQFAGGFHELGFNVGLLASKMVDSDTQSKIDRQFPGLVFRTEHTGAYPRAMDVSVIPRRAWRGIWKLRGEEYYDAQLSYGWASALNVDRVIRQFDSEGFKPDLLWGICGGYLDGGVAADKLANRLNLPWIFELRDPPRGCGLGKDRAAICAEFRRLLESSFRIVVTTRSYQEHLIERFSLNAQNVDVIYSLLEEEFQDLRDFACSSPWHIVYVGSLNEGRSLDPLLNGFCAAIDRQPHLEDNSIIDIAGSGLELVEMETLAKNIGINNNLCIHGYIPRDKVNALVKSAGILIVAQTNRTSRFQIPGKLFEYMSYGKPIIGIMPTECEAANILRHSGLGFIHSEADISGIADTLIRLYADWAAKRSSVKINHNYISQFSPSSFPNRLRSVLPGEK